jgi:hypothetical protein
MPEELAPQQERIRNVLAQAFRGIHHCGKIKKYDVGTINEMWETNQYGGMATYDFDQLTRLVIAAHDECVRVEISHSGPGLIKIRLWARENRGGKFFEKHPTMEEAIKLFRGL